MSYPKTACPITRQEFDDAATPVKIVVNGTEFDADPRQFSTQSMGWNVNAKVDVVIGGVKVKCQLGLNLTVVGSKELPKLAVAAA